VNALHQEGRCGRWRVATALSERDFKHASTLEGLRFTAHVAVPTVIRGLFRRQRTATAVATRTSVDGHAMSFSAGLRRSYGGGPGWIRVAKDEELLLLGRDTIRHALEGSPVGVVARAHPLHGQAEDRGGEAR
jgi:hypothetical protein